MAHGVIVGDEGDDVLLEEWLMVLFTLVTRRPYCPGRPKLLCFTTLSLAMETMGMRLSVVQQSFFGPPKGNMGDGGDDVLLEEWLMVLLLEMKVRMCYWKNG